MTSRNGLMGRNFVGIAFISVLVTTSCVGPKVTSLGTMELISKIKMVENSALGRTKVGYARELASRASSSGGFDQEEYAGVLKLLDVKALSSGTYLQVVRAVKSHSLDHPNDVVAGSQSLLKFVIAADHAAPADAALDAFLAISEVPSADKLKILNVLFQKTPYASVRCRIIQFADQQYVETGVVGVTFAEMLIQRLANKSEKSASCAYLICQLVENHQYKGNNAQRVLKSISNRDLEVLDFESDSYTIDGNKEYQKSIDVKKAARMAELALRENNNRSIPVTSAGGQNFRSGYQPKVLHTIAIIPQKRRGAQLEGPFDLALLGVDQLTDQLTRYTQPKIRLVNRRNLPEILQENKLSDFLEEAPKIGKFIAAEFYLFVQITNQQITDSGGHEIDLGGLHVGSRKKNVELTIKYELVEVTTGKNIFSVSVPVKQTFQSNKEKLDLPDTFSFSTDKVKEIPYSALLEQAAKIGVQRLYQKLSVIDGQFESAEVPQVSGYNGDEIFVSWGTESGTFEKGVRIFAHGLPVYVTDPRGDVIDKRRGKKLCELELVELNEEYSVFKLKGGKDLPPINSLIYTEGP